MPKVFHITLMLEVEDDALDPDQWDWRPIVTHVPDLRGFSLLDVARRPFSCMEDDPSNHTHH